jgi:plastocyanin
MTTMTRLSLCALLLLCGCFGGLALPGQTRLASRVHGHLEIVNQRAVQPVAIVPAVLYLEPVGASVEAVRERPEPAPVRHDGRGFTPALVAIGPGQGISLTNASGVHHRIFWLEGSERFAVDLPPDPGAAVRVDLGTSGIARFYCKLHSDEYFSVYVAPSHHFAILDAPGPYAIEGVAPGTWWLSIWSDALEGRVRELRVASEQDSVQDLRFDARVVANRKRR